MGDASKVAALDLDLGLSSFLARFDLLEFNNLPASLFHTSTPPYIHFKHGYANLTSIKMINFSCFNQSFSHQIRSFFRFFLFHVNPFWIQLSYFIIVSIFGHLALMVSKPRTARFRPKDFDVFFTSVSATTVSSMSTIELEVFSNTQLIIMTILMFVGGEVFTSFLGLQLTRSKFSKNCPSSDQNSVNLSHNFPDHTNSDNQIELDVEKEKPDINNIIVNGSLNYRSIKVLGYVVLGYLYVVHLIGSSLVSLYVNLVPSARKVLKDKGLETLTFSVFTTVSTFTNCGFVPTNENMIVFKKNSALLLLLIPQILMGNTLYPPCLLAMIWVLKKTTKREEFRYILMNYRDMGYGHLLSGHHALLLAMTVFGFILIQFILFCSMEWNSQVMDGLNLYQKVVGSLFQTVNSRHTGESVFDLSSISSAILVLFVVMMYLPPFTTFIPPNVHVHEEFPENGKQSQNRKKTFMECLIFSQLSYLAFFIILICITERQKMEEDPLNFNVLNVTIEVISAYGNVGFTTGYSCKRQLKPNSLCVDTWYGFVGRWSTKGKFILIIVMFFGRLKKFSMKGGQAWDLS
ncbi:sodium transporter HKT1-like [Quercus robur]|uniref:sodium transporter HKT1-like n=1 Tax=Quercus robur TaxID=38942 RepID=UPI0021624311|nr:sodium transporter HKT1-like [Quercus robur]